jgi:hypothetical protein
MRREIIEQFFELDQWVECNVRMHAGTVVRQLTSLRGTKVECLYGSSKERKKKGETDEKRIESARSLRKYLMGVQQNLISFKELRERGVPLAAHYGATEGLNRLEGRDVMVYGRLQPEPSAVELEARAIFCDDNRPIPHIKEWPTRPKQVPGQEYSFNCDFHPDPRVEAVRWTICEGETLQALHRARPIRHAVTITIASRQVVGVRVTELAHRRERLHPEYAALLSSDILPGRREMAQLWPGICADGRTADRLRGEVDTEGWGRIRYRRGKTKWSEAHVRKASAVGALGEVEWEWIEPVAEELEVLDELAQIDAREAMLVGSSRGLIDVRPHVRSYATWDLFGVQHPWLPDRVPMAQTQWPWAR